MWLLFETNISIIVHHEFDLPEFAGSCRLNAFRIYIYAYVRGIYAVLNAPFINSSRIISASTACFSDYYVFASIDVLPPENCFAACATDLMAPEIGIDKVQFFHVPLNIPERN